MKFLNAEKNDREVAWDLILKYYSRPSKNRGIWREELVTKENPCLI